LTVVCTIGAREPENGTERMTKKETLDFHREVEKLNKAIGGIKDMNALPDALFVIDVGYHKIAIQEAAKLGIPVVAIVDTNHSLLTDVSFVDPAEGIRFRGMSIPELLKALPKAPEEKKEACVFASNYGEAGAIDLYGPALGLPKAISGHNSYYMWGPQGCTGKVLITIGVPQSVLQASFESVEFAGRTSCQYCMPYENNAPIYIARGLKEPIDTVWPGTKSYS
jgi:hypothetical protein